MKCPECKTTLRGKTCPCGWGGTKEVKETLSNCAKCKSSHKRIYLKNWGGLEICSDCLTIENIPKEEREYLRAIAIAFDKDLVDMPTYLKTANAMGQQLEEYIQSMPLSREDFRKYYKGEDIVIGGIKI